MASKVTQGFIDYSGERSISHYYVDDGDVTGAGLVRVAMAVASLCNFTDQNLIALLHADTPTLPSSQDAQREQALWVQYADTTTTYVFSLSIPGVDRTLFAQAGTDEVDVAANVAALALIAVLEANLLSRDGNAIAVTRMRIIGRSN